MIDFLDYEIFLRVVRAGSLSAAGRQLNLSPSVISKRLSKLEDRLGERLLQRTTRRLMPTEAGRGFNERVVAVLAAVENAETFVSRRSSVAQGLLRVTAPTAFGRLHIAPKLKTFLDAHPQVELELDLTDDFVDLIANGFDIGVRIGVLANSSLVARRLAPNERLLCAAPSYLSAHGVPRTLADLHHHKLIASSNQSNWRLRGPEGAITYKAHSILQTNSSEVVREIILAGMGISLRSTWDVSEALRTGALRRVLPQYEGASDVGIYAIFPTRELMPTKVRVFVDFLVNLFGTEPYWDRNIALHAEEPVPVS